MRINLNIFVLKVLQKLNSKTNAAGWVPSSFNRTAGSFSSSQGTSKSISSLPGVKLQTLQHKKPTDADDTWNSIFPVENEELAYGKLKIILKMDTSKLCTHGMITLLFINNIYFSNF